MKSANSVKYGGHICFAIHCYRRRLPTVTIVVFFPNRSKGYERCCRVKAKKALNVILNVYLISLFSRKHRMYLGMNTGKYRVQLEAILQALHILHTMKWRTRNDIVLQVEDALLASVREWFNFVVDRIPTQVIKKNLTQHCFRSFKPNFLLKHWHSFLVLPREYAILQYTEGQCCGSRSESVASICFWESRIWIQIRLSELRIRLRIRILLSSFYL